MFDIYMLLIGGLLAFTGEIWILILAFQKSMVQGLLSLFIPFYIFIFGIRHWKTTEVPMILSIIGVVMTIFGLTIP